MPHPADYLAAHVTEAGKADKTLCLRCHVAEDCTRCHDAHVHAPLPPDARAKIQQGLTTTTTVPAGTTTTGQR
jgi:hypothetical protein